MIWENNPSQAAIDDLTPLSLVVMKYVICTTELMTEGGKKKKSLIHQLRHHQNAPTSYYS